MSDEIKWNGMKMRRLRQVVNNIIMEELQKGELPTSNKTLSRINTYTSQHDLANPSLEIRWGAPKQTVDSQDYSDMLDETYNDLSVLYSSLINLYNQATTNLKKYEIDRKKLTYQLDKLEAQLRELTLLYGDSGTLDSVYDTFADTTKINQTLTNAAVDIAKKEVTIANSKTSVTKVTPPDDRSVSFTLFDGLGALKSTAMGNIDNILTGASNEVWGQSVTSTSIQTVGGYVYITFGEPVVANKIVLSMYTMKPTTVKIEFCPDGINWLDLPYYEESESVTDTKTYDFPEIEFTQMRIALSKKDADNIYVVGTGPVKYSYILGIRELAFYNFNYVNRSTLVSNPLTVTSSQTFAIDKVSLDADTELPTGTWINYFVALNSTTPIWYQISDNDDTAPQYDQIIDFKNVEQAQPDIFNFPATTSPNEREVKSLSVNGIHFYQLGNLVDKKTIAGTEKLYRGVNSWKMESLVKDLGSTHVPVIDDWVGATGITTQYLPINTGKPDEVISNVTSSSSVSYRLSLTVYTETQNVQSAVPLCNCPVAIYVNGSLVFKGTPGNVVNYLFNKGWNEVVILIYKHSTTSSTNFKLRFDLTKAGARFYGDNSPLTLVNLFDLQYNVPNTNHDSYAITTINGKDTLILNHYMIGVDYEFHYKYATTTSANSILFKAELCRDDTVTALSPKLKSYRLRFSV